MDLERIKALCFDVDGTLRNTDDLYVHTLAKWLRPLRLVAPRFNPAQTARFLIMRAETPINLLYEFIDRTGMDILIARFLTVFPRKHVIPKPHLIVDGIQDMLNRLAQHYKLAIISAGRKHTTQAFLDNFQLTALFSAIATAQTCRYTKPFADPIRWAAGQMGVAPEQCLMIGDTTVDIRAGKAAGSQTVGVLCGFGQEAELKRAGCDLILPYTTQLCDVLLRKKK